MTRTIRFALVFVAVVSLAPWAAAQQLEDKTTQATSGTDGSASQKARISGANMSSGGSPASETTEKSLPRAADRHRTPPTAAGGTGPGGVDVTKDLFQH